MKMLARWRRSAIGTLNGASYLGKSRTHRVDRRRQAGRSRRHRRRSVEDDRDVRKVETVFK
jgi:hypothetical protein